jgi:hypothetical protein
MDSSPFSSHQVNAVQTDPDSGNHPQLRSVGHHLLGNWFRTGNQHLEVGRHVGKFVFLQLSAKRVDQIFDPRRLKLPDRQIVLVPEWNSSDQNFGHLQFL